jgi:hypothetical protein
MSITWLWAVISCDSYHDDQDTLIWKATSENHSCMNTITAGNSRENQWSTTDVFREKLSSNNCVMTETRSQALTEERILKCPHCPRQEEEPSCRGNPQSDTTSEEHLNIVLRIRSTNLQNYVPMWRSWLCLIWVRGHSHIFSTHCRWSAQLSAILDNCLVSGV